MPAHSPVIDAVLMLLALAGFLLAAYIHNCKQKKQPLVCPINGSCDAVTESAYGKFLGAPVEVLGMIYYALMTFSRAIVLAAPSAFTVTAALFSLYLVSVQAFVLKHWCTWCLCSALLCIAIFIVTIASVPMGILWK